VDRLLLLPIIEMHIQAPRYTDDELVEVVMRMSAPVFATGNIVDIEHALDIEGDMIHPFEEGEVPPMVPNLGEFNQAAIINGHGRSPAVESGLFFSIFLLHFEFGLCLIFF
jgi:hypothetical protein